MKADIIIIGGGAAGLMAAIGAAEEGGEVTILEKMPRPGRKIMITGKGRCNFTNVKPWNEFSTHIRSKSNFLRPAFYELRPEELIDFLERNGLECVVERGDRAFPASHRSMDVVDALTDIALEKGAKIETNFAVAAISSVGTVAEPLFVISSTDSEKTYTCSRLIIATGGLSYPTTGSTGDGYKWAAQFGHKIQPCFPSLTAMVPEGYKAEKPEKNGHLHREAPLTELGERLCGISLKNCDLTLFANGNLLQSEFGDLDFTDGGIEGPIGFSLSRNCVKALINGSKVRIEIDMKHGASVEELRTRVKSIWEDIQKDPRSGRLSIKEILRVLLGKLMPWELIPGFSKCNPMILSGKKGNERIDMDVLCQALKHWSFDIVGYVGYERCVITAGGVSTDEVLPKTMESRLHRGLYFCGEILDIDADTGGYNLHCAFATGHLAGKSAAKSLD